MARLARIVIPDVPHHVTQRGNRRLPVFFCDDDRVEYLTLVAQAAAASKVLCLAWCLMDNHVHLILVPSDEDGLRATLGGAHRRYTRMVNFREGWRGPLFQRRFASYPMDEAHMMAALVIASAFLQSLCGQALLRQRSNRSLLSKIRA